MPVDPSHNSQARRASRKLSADDENNDARRARGEIACAECRRLKLKCDKKLPCSSCVRRGCPSICPNGTLSIGQGTRFVLTDTGELHAKISEMSQRIRQLEDALSIFQASISSESHPLLRDDLLAIKYIADKGHVPEKEHTLRETSTDLVDALGTLTIGSRGDSKYFGRSAGSEVRGPSWLLLFFDIEFYYQQFQALLLAGAELDSPDLPTCEDEDLPTTSEELTRLSHLFPFGAEGNAEQTLDLLFKCLPSQPRAWSLCETYLEHAAWAFRPMKRDEIIDDLLSPTYKALKERKIDTNNLHSVSSHKLAVLFIIFALGAFVDLTLEPNNAESDTYYHLARACLSLRSVFDSPEIATVQAVALMASYHGMGGKRMFSMDSTWSLMSLASKLAQSLGLHRDSARWNMDLKTVQRRRTLFWEMFSVENSYNLGLGRPPSIHLSYVDCEFPIDDEARLDDNGNILVGFHQWKYEFTKEVFAPVTELTLTAETPQYQVILELDRKVREKVLPPHLNVFMSREDEHCTPSVYMRGCLLGQFRSIAMLYIHRSFFAQAMLDYPANPLHSPYAPSFLAAYRCASGVIKANLNHFDRFNDLCCRMWSLWTHLFSAAIIVGCIVTRSPSSSMAPSAFIELGLACDLFERGASHSRRARSGLIILRNLRERASHVFSRFRAGKSNPTSAFSIGKPDYGDDELALFGGQTRVLLSKLLINRGVNRRTSTASPIPPTPNPVSPSADSDVVASPVTDQSVDIHPSLVEFLSSSLPTQNLGSNHSTSSVPNNTSSYNVQGTSQLHASEQGMSMQSWQLPLTFTGAVPGTSADHIYPNSSNSVGDRYPSKQVESAPPLGQVEDFGMMMTGESGMDEQWMAFMRDSGFLPGRLNGDGQYDYNDQSSPYQ